MERLKMMKDMLISIVEGQMTHLDCVDTEELGEVVDMIKDFEEAIYYHTITEAMNQKEQSNGNGNGGNIMYFMEPSTMYRSPYRDMDREMGRMYYNGSGGGSSSGGSGGSSSGGSGGSSSGGSSSNSGGGGSSGNSGGGRNGGSSGGSSTSYFSSPYGMMESEYPLEFRDYREGRSPKSRKMYMESKENHQGKAAQMKELEKYVQELTQDLTEMVEDASPEEQQYLANKVQALSAKISALNK